ncbi:hypothetical protein VE04_07455 [Pseudogymnoascus sp. 24MN13]|nr:hypothetical protein VE04_07455 [Pseudogymnoascus sp. 24MN13]
MQVSLYSIAVGLCLFHIVLGGSVALVGPGGAAGDVMTCDNDNYDDKQLADILQYGGSLHCGNEKFDDFQIQCRAFGGAATCKPALS